MRQKIKSLLKIVKEMEETSREAAKKAKNAANELSAGLVSSWSIAGDVEHAKNSANLNVQKHASTKNLLEELEKAANENIPSKTGAVSFAKIEFEDGGEKEVYIVNNPIYVTGFNLISPNSLLGSALMEKCVGDTFFYISNDRKLKGKVLEIE